MCFGSGSKEDPEAKKSKEIEKQLREDQKRLSKEVKLLLLGMAYLRAAAWMTTDVCSKVRASPASRLC